MRIAITILLLAAACRTLPAAGPPDSLKSNIVEYGCGYYGEDDYEKGVPTLHPPKLKLYADGRLIVQEAEGVETRSIGTPELARLKRRVDEIAAQPAEQLESGRRPLLMHGGLCYVVFGSGGSEVIRLFEGIPGGSVGRLLDRLRKEDGLARGPFIPEHILIEVERTSPASTDDPWPFSIGYDLAKVEPGTTWRIDDPTVLNYLFKDPIGTFWRVRIGERSFRLRLREVKGWYDPRGLSTRIEHLLTTAGQLSLTSPT